MSSSRLPGKVLAPILGRPMINLQLERISRARSLDAIVVATSVDESDDPLADAVADLGYPVVRGSLDDVLSRFLSVLDEMTPNRVVRLTADCPLTSPHVIERVVDFARAGDFDYASNTLERTYPDGLDVEVLTPAALQWLGAHALEAEEREHVTIWAFRRPDRFTLGNYAAERDLSHLRWTVDEPEDLDVVREVYQHLYPSNPTFDVAEIIAAISAGRIPPHLSTKARNI
ncbi:MAG: glycosyltransferase family protein [Candidatus Nanopelagicales bacterium]|nr:glycosyltransferase family protein [Candidatus Nanopelagicales bacterium]MCF8536791.1 glycosyltransferase family protein [Candidatus Nanopelagicales bacterium]MCF8541776.1 glycosyltransferase family protein [Candidatus Nanopelagicales bacterium]MCF8556183.1 glycosyltransferase family protein [Candidatus Nanopelagicales bacterium]